jgi:hypothetical protein
MYEQSHWTRPLLDGGVCTSVMLWSPIQIQAEAETILGSYLGWDNDCLFEYSSICSRDLAGKPVYLVLTLFTQICYVKHPWL